MTALLLVPLVLPFLAPRLARRTFDRLAPATALWVLTASALALAGACVAALGSLVLTGLLKFPAFAALGELVHPLRTPSDYLVLPAAAAATGVLTLGAWTLVRSAFLQTRAFRTARTQADRRPAMRRPVRRRLTPSGRVRLARTAPPDRRHHRDAAQPGTCRARSPLRP